MQSEIWRSLEAVIGLDAASAWGTLTEQNGGGALPAGNGDGQGLQLSRVILLSNEPSVRATLETAIGEQQRLIVASGFDELRAALEAPAEAVVVDVAASERLDAWERVRTQHAGMVLVAVDSQDETREWPPDPARRFLVRPLHAEEIVAALAAHPRILREPAAARRRRLAQARRPPVVPPLAVAPDHAPAAIEPVRRLSSGESLWEEPGDQADPTAADAPPEPRLPGLGRLDRQRSRLTAAVMLLLLLATAVPTGNALGGGHSPVHSTAAGEVHAQRKLSLNGVQTVDVSIWTKKGETLTMAARERSTTNCAGLPMTGASSAPILVLGAVLLAAGAVLVWRTREA